MIPTLPGRARQRLSATILGALADPEGRAELARIAQDSSAAETWLGPAPPGVADRLRARAARAWVLLRARPLARRSLTLAEALEWAALLFDGGLGFEVHELLEPFWRQAEGQEREALQGLVQIAAGYQLLADGRPEGARSLLREGASRLVGRRLAGLPLEHFAEGVEASLARLGAAPADRPAFPRWEPGSRGEL